MEVLKIETALPVQTNSFFPSLENAGDEETRLFPPVIILISNSLHIKKGRNRTNIRKIKKKGF